MPQLDKTEEALFRKEFAHLENAFGNDCIPRVKQFIAESNQRAVEAERERAISLVEKIKSESNHPDQAWYDALRCVISTLKSLTTEETD